MSNNRVKHYFQAHLNDPKLLAELRESFIPRGSGPLSICRAIVELIEAYADLKGWNLDDYIPANERLEPSEYYKP